MFDINKTTMRCLVKNIAMFGLGDYIYAGEDLPESAKTEIENLKKTVARVKRVISEKGKVKENQSLIKEILVKHTGGTDFSMITSSEIAEKILDEIDNIGGVRA